MIVLGLVKVVYNKSKYFFKEFSPPKPNLYESTGYILLARNYDLHYSLPHISSRFKNNVKCTSNKSYF